MRSLFIGIAALSVPFLAAQADGTVKSGRISYHAHYLTKTVNGTTHELLGKTRCHDSKCEFLVATPVKSFDSENANRDSHMLEAVKGLRYPHATVAGEALRTAGEYSLLRNVKVTLAGVEATYPDIPLRKTGPGCVAGEFHVVLTRHQVERPSLLGVSIRDDVPVDFETCFTE